jgi:hypothetical protein
MGRHAVGASGRHDRLFGQGDPEIQANFRQNTRNGTMLALWRVEPCGAKSTVGRAARGLHS